MTMIKGLKEHFGHITAVVSMADDGGSGGRLRRLYNMLPPGDVASCMASLTPSQNPLMAQLLMYRFPGDRYGKDHEIYGQRLGGLMLAAANDLTGSFPKAIDLLKELFQIKEDIIPATTEQVSIIAKTKDGRDIHGEENIDVGKIHGDSPLESVSLIPADIAAAPEALEAMHKADILIAGPGDLYTTVLPCITVPAIKDYLVKSDKKKIFVVNVATKPFETKGYTVHDFVEAIRYHFGTFPFQTVIANDNFSVPMPNDLEYDATYVELGDVTSNDYELITGDLVNDSLPIYHDPKKLASLVAKTI